MAHSTVTFSPSNLQSTEQIKAFKRFREIQKETDAMATQMRGADNVDGLDLDPARDRVAVADLGINGRPFSGVAHFDGECLQRLSIEHASLEHRPPDFYGKLELKHGFETSPQQQIWTKDRVSGWADWQGILMEETTTHERFTVDAASGAITYDLDAEYYRDSD
ncbi:MAG: hypothetical protein FJX76_12345 [Armatimonadetes bacterium]|nr:hypothetical protein [Armatimonadota bacterium]